MTDTVKSWIEERRAAMDEATEALTPDGCEPDFLGLPRALNALNKVLELHRRAVDIFEPSEFCAACSTDRRTVEWPCATVQAIGGAVND